MMLLYEPSKVVAITRLWGARVETNTVKNKQELCSWQPFNLH